MKIEYIKTWGVEGFGETSYDLRDGRSGAARDFTVIDGAGGSGKTRLLELIARAKEGAAPYGAPMGGEDLVAAGATAAKVEIGWALRDIEIGPSGGSPSRSTETIWGSGFGSGENDAALVDVLGRYSLHPERGKVEYFHAPRALPYAQGATGSKPSAEAEAPFRLVADDRKYASLGGFIVNVALDALAAQSRGVEKLEGLAMFQRAFGALCPSVRFRGFTNTQAGLEPEFEAKSGRVTPLSRLSASERQAFLFAATFLRSGINYSVVLVDTPELGLASEAVVPFVSALRKLGLENQVIVATGSKELAASVPNDHVITLKGT